MSSDLRSVSAVAASVAAVSILVLSGALFVDAPLTPREQRIASLARDAADSGEWPVLLHAESELWFQPLEIYPAAWLLRTGLAEAAALRLPAAVAGVLSAWLLALVASRALGARVGAIAAILLLLVPSYMVHARTGGADLMIAPPVLAWLMAVLAFVQRPRAWLPIAGGFALATAFYTQPAGVISVPVYFVIGSTMLVRSGRWAAVAHAGAAVVVCALPLVILFVREPASYQDTFGRWAIHLAHIRNPWDGLIAFTRWEVMGRRASAYWESISPSYLFLSGEMFSVVFAILLPIGLWVLATEQSPPGRVLIAAFLTAPIAAALLDIERRASLLLLAGVLGAAVGARGLEAIAGFIVQFMNIKRSRHERA